MKELNISIKLQEYSDEGELTKEQRNVLEQARVATQYSYSPYSNFKVGAAALMENGEIILGSNQENASFPAGICAERSAIYNAAHQFKDQKIKRMAITVRSTSFKVDHPIAPCGVCRQVLLETELRQGVDIEIILQGTSGGIYIINSSKDLLPFFFYESGLKKGETKE